MDREAVGCGILLVEIVPLVWVDNQVVWKSLIFLWDEIFVGGGVWAGVGVKAPPFIPLALLFWAGSNGFSQNLVEELCTMSVTYGVGILGLALLSAAGGGVSITILAHPVGVWSSESGGGQ